jgi:hypothetical protein
MVSTVCLWPHGLVLSVMSTSTLYDKQASVFIRGSYFYCKRIKINKHRSVCQVSYSVRADLMGTVTTET